MSSLITPLYFDQQMATLGLKQKFTPDAEALDTLIVEASDWVEGYCDRKFALADYSESIRVPHRRGSSTILLDNYPVTSIDSIAWEDTIGGSGTYGTDLIWFDPSGVIEWKNPSHYSWDGSIRYVIGYEAGYATIPSNVQRAVALKIANLIQPQYQGVQEREIFMVSNIEGMIIDLLEQYRRERLG